MTAQLIALHIMQTTHPRIKFAEKHVQQDIKATMKHFFVTYAPEHVQNVIGKIVAPNVSKILISQ